MNLDFNVPVLALAGGLILLLVIVLIYGARVAQTVGAAPSGPPTGAASMERKVAAISAMLLGTVLISLGYGIREPARQAVAQEALLDVSIGRGIGNFTTLCFSCHGEKGQGALVPGADPIRLAPALNRPDLRPTDADERKKRYDFVFKTLVRGRPGTPMPAWGQSEGGALLDEQINELTLLILNGDRTLSYEGTRDTAWGHVETIIKREVDEGTIKALPEQPSVEVAPFFQALSDQEKQGVRTILAKNCGSCHIIPNIPGATGAIGPNLGAAGGLPLVSQRKLIAGGVVPNASVEDLSKWILNPPAVKPGTAMPNLGLSAEDARAVAAYLYTLK